MDFIFQENNFILVKAEMQDSSKIKQFWALEQYFFSLNVHNNDFSFFCFIFWARNSNSAIADLRSGNYRKFSFQRQNMNKLSSFSRDNFNRFVHSVGEPVYDGHVIVKADQLGKQLQLGPAPGLRNQ